MTNTNPILILGAQGLIGSALMEVLADKNPIGLDMPECDVTRPDQVNETFKRFQGGVVINATGYTNVDGCESARDEAEKLNSEAPGMLARAAREHGALLVHLSTDFIFDGTLDRPYREDDSPNPLSVYGRTKLAGEEAVRSEAGDWLIVRTAWVFGHQGHDFIRTMIKLAQDRKDLRVVNDQTGCPTYSLDISQGLTKLIEADARGTFHLVNSGQTTWFNLARCALDMAGFEEVPIKPVTTQEFARPAVRPFCSVLDITKYRKLTGDTPRSWDKALKAALEREGYMEKTNQTV
ncbi:MAG: dTDP-4-dehydrorhamnose reductase [Deltaproteobacteria bacterium]|nr:dTDP-4-dehydrorhamnose reductase [Deltaproteobacteria bacterium]MBW2051273.1 dTDP-4-dehydrorhamnose reductase [Deltaproteobacteria bacterium]MBW2139917.1 dTDP-4-dehydrorhamnose reductase [Deltaproteobacteria bacterium]MBW2322382.1 dTDP-4-dehydrorhamnose reductase [Deltaproteobacteria bacterium]